MPFPQTEEQLVLAGYKYEKTCKCTGPDCGREIRFYRTPKGKRIPLDTATLRPHWETCKDAGSFRGPRKSAAKASDQKEYVQRQLRRSWMERK